MRRRRAAFAMYWFGTVVVRASKDAGGIACTDLLDRSADHRSEVRQSR
jgi:hypothetical protein